MADNVTAEDIKNFCSDARVLYRRLAVDNARDLLVCMEAIALWIFLEGMGFPNLVKKLLRTDDKVLNMIMDEASLCFGWIESITPPLPSNVSDIPFTQELMGGKPLNSALVYRNRMDVLRKVNATVSESFSVSFEDIIREVSGMSFAELSVQPLLPDQHDARSFPYHYPQQAPRVVGQPLYGLKSTDGVDIAVYPLMMFSSGSESSAPINLPNKTPLDKEEHVPEIKHGIFFTFYRQNPVQQRELESFLERSFGDGCIEKVTMQQVPDNETPLWASVVFCSEIPVLAIMQGRETAPMSINGKKVWAGKEWM